MSQTRRGPFTITGSSTIYTNPWIQVDEYQVLKPNGNPGIYGVVSFLNRAIAVLPLADNGDTWLIGQHRFPFDEYHWEIPMGGGPLDESAEDSALRELREETGLRAGTLTPVGRFCVSNCITNEEAFCYVATDLSEGETEFDDTEVLQIRRLPFQDAFEMAMDGRITDLVTVATIQRVRLLGIA
jgi:ADP-ribose pyrophosphatase